MSNDDVTIETETKLSDSFDMVLELVTNITEFLEISDPEVYSEPNEDDGAPTIHYTWMDKADVQHTILIEFKSTL